MVTREEDTGTAAKRNDQEEPDQEEPPEQAMAKVWRMYKEKVPWNHPNYNLFSLIEFWYRRQYDIRFKGLKAEPQEIFIIGPSGIRKIHLWTMKITRVERDDGPRDEYPTYEDEHQDQDPPDVGCFMMESTSDPSAPTES